MIKLLVITLISFFYFYESKSEDYEIVIVANVGKEVITNYDIMQRLRFISYQSGMQISEDNFTQLFFQTREILIDEIIKPRTFPGSLKRTSAFVGCTFTSTSTGLHSKNNA